jgi:hypothetical protein
MEKSRVTFVLMFPIFLTIIAMVLILFTDTYIGGKIILDFILGSATTILIILAGITALHRD